MLERTALITLDVMPALLPAMAGDEALVGRLRSAAAAARAATIDVVATLPGGTLHLRGKNLTPSAESWPVVGGTGVFKGAKGTLTVVPIGDGTRATNVYRLR